MGNSNLTNFPLFVHVVYDQFSNYQNAEVSATAQEIYEACAEDRAVFVVVQAADASELSNDVPFESLIAPLVGASYVDEEYTAIFSMPNEQYRYLRMDSNGLNLVPYIDYIPNNDPGEVL